ncbi:MAG: DUF3667 domain-containing protein [Lysobacter sp.]|nr:DUF3667 domain-containing protein [Lysobacter sp.]
MTDPIDSSPEVAEPIPAPPVPAPAARACENCGVALLGEHCYACGQPVKGLVRHFSSILGDFADSVFSLDTRLPRTLWPLFARPAFLTCEYFAGRRVRYVSPVRLFVFLTIVTFFIAQLTVNFGDGDINIGSDNSEIGSATSVAEVEKVRDRMLGKLANVRKQVGNAPGAGAGISKGEDDIRDAATARIEMLREAQAKGEPVPEPTPDTLSFGDSPWDAEKNPIKIDVLPGFANDWLNKQAGRANKNIERLKQDPNQFKDALMSAIPSTLFVLLPVFAVMLKLLYAFKKRLYMEHLIVALHSHAFLSLMLLLMLLTIALQRWLAPGSGALNSAFGWLEAAMWVWMPFYLLLMQKRIYGQGWPMTLLKYCVLGICYVVLLSFGAVFTLLFSLVWM